MMETTSIIKKKLILAINIAYHCGIFAPKKKTSAFYDQDT